MCAVDGLYNGSPPNRQLAPEIQTNSYLEERLHFIPLRDRLFAHALGDLSRVPIDTGDDGMRVRSLLGSLVKLLDHDNLSSGLSALEDDGDL